jgi:hypothetical protein
LLLPPLTLGAAFYSMLAPPDEGATRPAGAQAVQPEAPRDPIPPWGVSTDRQRAAQGAQPVAGKPSSVQGRSSASATGAYSDPVNRPAEDMARVPDPPLPLSFPTQAPPPIPLPAQTPDAQAPVATDLPPGEGSPATSSTPAKPVRPPNRRSAQHRQNEFSLKNFFEQLGNLPQQLGIVPRNTPRG